jgi:hypothetical protein
MHYDQLSGKERAALFALVAEARRVSNPELRELSGFALDGKERRKLNDLKLVESDKPGRAYEHELTDAGWRWVADELDLPRRDDAGYLESGYSLLLARFGRYLRAGGLSLADIVREENRDAEAEEPTVPPAHEPADVEARVLSAYHAAAEKPGQFVKLADLRRQVTDVPRADVDAVLDRLFRSQRINLIPQSSPRALTPEDREAAFRIGGENKHLISEVR